MRGRAVTSFPVLCRSRCGCSDRAATCRGVSGCTADEIFTPCLPFRRSAAQRDQLILSPPYGRTALSDTTIRSSLHLSVCLSHGAAALGKGYRHADCPQLSHRRPLEMCGLRTRPRTDVDPPRFLPPSNCRRRGALSSRRPRGDSLF